MNRLRFRKHRALPWGGFLLASLLWSNVVAYAGNFRIVPERSVFAVVTRKGGLAGRLAHDHFIAASNYTAGLELPNANRLETRFHIRFDAKDLLVDRNELAERWYPRLQSLGILSTPFREVSDEDREKIRETMLSGKQLDAVTFPEISAHIISIEEETKTLGDAQFSHRVSLALRVRGRTVEKPVWARYELVDDVLRVEAVGQFGFGDFGIKPYSAMLGTVKVKDEFHLFVAIEAVSEP